MNEQLNELQRIAILRDLKRRPELAHVARMLYFITLATGAVVEPDTPPIFLKIAKELIDDHHKRQNFLMALDVAVQR